MNNERFQFVKQTNIVGHLMLLSLKIDDILSSKNIKNSDGHLKSGPTKALLEGEGRPQLMCAAMISEVWKHVHGEYPPQKRKEAIKAAYLLWKAAGFDTPGWGDVPENAWTYWFRVLGRAPSRLPLAQIRSEILEAQKAGLRANPS